MRRFTQLFTEIDRTTRTSEKLAAMVRYFRQAPPEDAAWALFFLSGRKIKRLVTSRLLHELMADRTGLPDWLISESYEAVGDFGETLALLAPERTGAKSSFDMPLHQLVEQRIVRLRSLLEDQQRALIAGTWDEMNLTQRFVFNKLITGNFRVGVAQTLIIKALAEAADVSPAVMAHRFAGGWEPTAESYLKLMRRETASDNQGSSRVEGPQPYPFYLAYPLEDAPDSLGALEDWQIEWKYDGIRAQLIKRGGSIVLWSRGDELITLAFPEIENAARELPDGTVLDGEVVAWEDDHPLPFALLQRRLNRKKVEATLWTDVPVVFVAFDVLEQDGRDWREASLIERRQGLERLISAPLGGTIRTAPLVQADSWEDLARQRESARALSVEGVMIKRRNSGYGVGRKRGDWWKWKVNPFTVDAVLIYAQGGSGRRSGLFTDYTFGVWAGGEGDAGRELVPVAKAYSGLTDAEIREVDRFIRRNTMARHGPVRIVKPELVFELAFEAIQESNRHKAGIALRFPRMSRWRKDKTPAEADTIQTLRALLRQSQRL